jgi:hypothetical protein
MNTENTLPDDRTDSLTVRHLRELRRSQEMMIDLLKRQSELTGRLARDIGEVKISFERSVSELKSDMVLQENRSITAAENNEYFRRSLDEINERLSDMASKIEHTP